MNDQVGKTLDTLTSESASALRNGEYTVAIRVASEIIRRQPNHAEAHAVQFSALLKEKKFEKARSIGTLTAKLNPKSLFILNNQARLQLEAKQPAAAVGLLKSLIDQFGERSHWLYNLALAQRMIANYDYSISMFRRTLDHQPEHELAASQLADCLRAAGKQEEAVSAYNYVRLLRNKHAPSHSHYIHSAVINNSITPADLKNELNLWQERFIPKNKRYTCTTPHNKNKLNIGFLIGALPLSWLQSIAAPIINCLSQKNDLITVYWHDKTGPAGLFNDNVTVVLSAGLTDSEFSKHVRADKIDVMIDVCGMRLGNRQRPLGLQLAHKQYGWLAHEGQYASKAVNIIEHSLGKQRFFIAGTETSINSLPANTFSGIGCSKGLSYSVIKIWAQILHLSPTWNLHLDVTDRSVKNNLIQRFEELGIHKNRLIFNPKLSPSYGQLVLDNFLNNDPVAAYSAISSGSILLTLKGQLFPAAQNAALLQQLNKTEWLCRTPAHLVECATLFTNNKLTFTPINQTQLKNSEVHNLESFTVKFRQAISS